MMAGIQRMAGWDSLPSQLQIVSSWTPICAATWDWSRSRSSRRARRWSPKLFKYLG